MNDKAVIDALVKIASYPRGGVIPMNSPEADRDDMIGAARQALKAIGYTWIHPEWRWTKIDDDAKR